MAETELVAITEILSAALRALERAHAGTGLRIVRQVDPTAPEIEADKDEIHDLIETLLAEAAAGTVEGGRIRVCLKHSRGTLMLSVKDEGPGLKAGEFDARVKDPDRAPVEGAPLTLGACKEIVDSMRGNFFANTQPGKGATYYVVLPLPV